ncbi:hypothetical protein BJ165DRAFT_1509488 [Panaeolus papilionaceus]|nr:hypothetical protein BJ165DRAFT_1509488 [Panaeolus papilionaceus]
MIIDPPRSIGTDISNLMMPAMFKLMMAALALVMNHLVSIYVNWAHASRRPYNIFIFHTALLVIVLHALHSTCFIILRSCSSYAWTQ